MRARVILFPMPCPECDRLAANVDHREREYAFARGCLVVLAETDDAREYQKLMAESNGCRIEAELARRELENHQMIHTGAN
jgi:hypothetical protein